MFCQNCGKEISEGQSFCPYCGNVTVRNQVKAAGYMPAPTAVGNIPNAQPYRQPVNQEKAKKRREKMGIAENQIRDVASIKTKTIESKANYVSSAQKELELEKAKEKKANAKAGSMAAKANMVNDFNNRNSRK